MKFILGTQSNIHRSALTRIDILVLVFTGLLILLASLFFIPRGPKHSHKNGRIRCVNNLKNLGLAFRIYAFDNNHKFPMAGLTMTNGVLVGFEATSIFQMLSNELSTPKILICPADSREPALTFSDLSTTNASYFLALLPDESNPDLMLLGDRNITTNEVPAGPGLVDLSSVKFTGWTAELHNKRGNVCMGDGSVQQLANTEIKKSPISTNSTRLLVP